MALEQVAEREAETVPAVQERAEEQAQTIALEQPETAQDKAPAAAGGELGGDDGELLRTLLHRIASAGSGTKVAVRAFAREVRIGNERASRILQEAAARGAIRKTAAGYVAA
ncbi:hypothetical protein D3C78_1492480 [compost metagenome]